VSDGVYILFYFNIILTVSLLFFPVTVALKTKMGTYHWWNGSDKGRPKFTETEIDVNYISGFKVCLTENTQILHYKDQTFTFV
jgi:hypothetical protein